MNYPQGADERSANGTIIVVPCYNEAKRVELHRFAAFAAASPRVAFLFVDDGSTDATGDLLEKFCLANPGSFQLLRMSCNRGKAEAVRQGILSALTSNPAYLGFWDADLATPLEAINSFQEILDQRAEIQLVLGSRVQLLGRQIYRTPRRHYLGRVFATAVSLMLGLRVYDTQCGAKLFRASPVMRELFATPFRSRWIFDVELLARLIHARRKSCLSAASNIVCEYPLLSWRDVHGSKLRSRDFFIVPIHLFAVYWAYLRKDWRQVTPPLAEPGVTRAPTRSNGTG